MKDINNNNIIFRTEIWEHLLILQRIERMYNIIEKVSKTLKKRKPKFMIFVIKDKFIFIYLTAGMKWYVSNRPTCTQM